MSTINFYCVSCGTALQMPSDSLHDLVECHACARYVPVPRPVDLRGRFTNCQTVLPSRVLELTVTFDCTECGSRLRTDARWEGRGIRCPDCDSTTSVPRWSTVPSWPSTRGGRGALPRPPIETKAAVLSAEEIEFLRGEEPVNPEAAA
jgi:DNA-directed RNA polymerase subunit RPC12/RpoP